MRPTPESSVRSRGRKHPTKEAMSGAIALARQFMARHEVTGISIGEPSKDGRCIVGELALCIHVREKLPKHAVSESELLPKRLHGVRVDVEQRNHRPLRLSDHEMLRRNLQPAEPVVPGVQVGVKGRGAGTLGLFVYDRVDGHLCLLSAAHVFGDQHRSTVMQPAPQNAGMPAGSVRRWILNRNGDAGIAAFDRLRSWSPLPLGATDIRGVRRVKCGDILIKSGATTGVTRARVARIGEFEAYPGYPGRWMHGFELRPIDPGDAKQISDVGDSGSVWCDEEGLAVGLTVAGDRFSVAGANDWALCCHLESVFNRLAVSLDPDDRISG